MADMTYIGPESSWRKRRLAVGLSLRELSRRSKVNRGTISRIERGWPATASDAAALTKALDAAEGNAA